MHTKKPLSILLTLALVLGLLPWTVMPARAEALTAMPAAVNGKITLNKDVNLSSAWEVNGTVTLDLNGHTVRRSLDGLTESGYVIKINEGASLTLEDSGTGGKITGGKNSTAGGGGGVYVYEGTFIMNGGSITGNRADTSGGGVLVRYSATFIMNGGSITDNISDNNGGGGVAVMNKAKFTMNGGSISFSYNNNNTIGIDSIPAYANGSRGGRIYAKSGATFLELRAPKLCTTTSTSLGTASSQCYTGSVYLTYGNGGKIYLQVVNGLITGWTV